MVSHSCSASLSSSYFSHTASSSRSSPPSSPDSAPPSSQDSLPPASSPASSSTLALVPFLWEEKPGVLKREMQSSKKDGAHMLAKTTPPVRHASLSCSRESRAPLAGNSDVYSSTSYSRTITGPRAKMRSESVPRLRPPPCLSQPNHHVHALPSTDEDADMLRLHHHHFRAGVRSKVMSSFHFHKRRHHRTPSIEDDPFWMAMVACTNEPGNKGSRSMRCKSNRETEVQRSESWIVKRVHGNTISFEQCMPHRTSAAHSAVSHGGKSVPSRTHISSNLKNEARSLKGPATKPACTSSRDAMHAQDQQACTDMGARSPAHLASKAFKALNLAKSEVHGRCKALLQQQSSPVDISCSTRGSKKPSFTAKHKKGDIFGCKSDHSLIVPP